MELMNTKCNVLLCQNQKRQGDLFFCGGCRDRWLAFTERVGIKHKMLPVDVESKILEMFIQSKEDKVKVTFQESKNG